MDLPPVEQGAMPPPLPGPPIGWTRIGPWFIRNQAALQVGHDVVSDIDTKVYYRPCMPTLEYVCLGMLSKHIADYADYVLIGMHAEKMQDVGAISVDLVFSPPWNCAHKSLFGIDD